MKITIGMNVSINGTKYEVLNYNETLVKLRTLKDNEHTVVTMKEFKDAVVQA